jgi:hypothetical protein
MYRLKKMAKFAKGKIIDIGFAAQPNKYLKGKIYKVVCNITGEIYIGSTVLRLSQRLYVHKNCNQQTRCVEIIKRGDFDIVLIEEFPCENRM